MIFFFFLDNTKSKDKIFGSVPHCPTPTRAEIQTLMERVYGCGPLDGGAEVSRARSDKQ